MIINSNKPYSKEEIKKLRECFDVYIKTVIDLENKICSGGAEHHFESEEILLKKDSKQKNLWGGGIDLNTMIIDCNSFINIRPKQNNPANEILDLKIRKRFEKMMKYFFKNLYEK